jgi:hypothetical protein
MASFFQRCHLRSSGAFILLWCLFPWPSASYKLESQSNLAPFNAAEGQGNASISVYDASNGCYCPSQAEYCNKYRQNSFTLAPEVCLTGFGTHKALRVEKGPHCVGHNGTSLAILTTYAGRNCTGNSIVQHLPTFGSPCVKFPFEIPWVGPPHYWSIIFHCHSEPFNKSLDPFEWENTMGGQLQQPVKPHIPLAMCENRLPRLTDGSVRLAYNNNRCKLTGMDPWKYYNLPTDTCQSTYGGSGLKIEQPAICKNDSRARLARYLDDGCKLLGDITDVMDEDMAWDACRILNDTVPHIGSFAFYCDGLDDGATAVQEPIETTKIKDLTVFDLAPNLQATRPIPPKPVVPFWQGLVLVDRVSGSRGGQYLSPYFQTIDRDKCFSIYTSPLRIYQVPRCWNGTRAHVTFFEWDRCKGTPIFYNGNDKEVLEHQFCMSYSTGYRALAFWCEGEGITDPYVSAPGKQMLVLESAKKLFNSGGN